MGKRIEVCRGKRSGWQKGQRATYGCLHCPVEVAEGCVRRCLDAPCQWTPYRIREHSAESHDEPLELLFTVSPSSEFKYAALCNPGEANKFGPAQAMHQHCHASLHLRLPPH